MIWPGDLSRKAFLTPMIVLILLLASLFGSVAALSPGRLTFTLDAAGNERRNGTLFFNWPVPLRNNFQCVTPA